MAHPKRQHSKQRSRKRRGGKDGLKVPSSIPLNLEGTQNGVAHRVDPVTGFYKGRQIIAIKQKTKKESE